MISFLTHVEPALPADLQHASTTESVSRQIASPDVGEELVSSVADESADEAAFNGMWTDEVLRRGRHD